MDRTPPAKTNLLFLQAPDQLNYSLFSCHCNTKSYLQVSNERNKKQGKVEIAFYLQLIEFHSKTSG